MTRGRPKRHPSLRNLELYHEIVYLGLRQTEVAGQFSVSPARAAAICQQVKDWVDALLPSHILAQAVATSLSQRQAASTGSPERETTENSQSNAESETLAAQLTGNPACRLHLALAIRRVQLTRAYGNYLDCFGGLSQVLQLAPVVATWKDGKLARQISDMLPSMHLVESAVQMAQELEGLANLALRGPFFDLPDRMRTRAQPTESEAPSSAGARSAYPEPVILPSSNTALPAVPLALNP
jgi:hypothetical protein